MGLVICNTILSLLCFYTLVYPRISLSLLRVQALDESLDIGNWIGPRVMAARAFFLVARHFEALEGLSNRQ